MLGKLLSMGKVSKPINWYLSDSHVFGGVNESVTAEILCGGPVCSFSTTTQVNLPNDKQVVKKVMLLLRKYEKPGREVDTVQKVL